MAKSNHSRNTTLNTRLLPTEECIIYLLDPILQKNWSHRSVRKDPVHHPVAKTKVTILLP